MEPAPVLYLPMVGKMNALFITRDELGYDMYRTQPTKDLGGLWEITDMGDDVVFESMVPEEFERIFDLRLEVGEITEVFIQTKETPWPVSTK